MKKILLVACLLTFYSCGTGGSNEPAKPNEKKIGREPAKPIALRGGKTLNFVIQKQSAKNLCWAACGASISKFYDPNSQYQQCVIANKVLNQTKCCIDITKCDKTAKLSEALQVTGNYKDRYSGIPTFDVIKNQIVNGHVIALRINWNDNNQGHFIVIHGFHDDGKIDVQDPWPESNPGTLSLTELALFYDGVGSITDYYLTKKEFE